MQHTPDACRGCRTVSPEVLFFAQYLILSSFDLENVTDFLYSLLLLILVYLFCVVAPYLFNLLFLLCLTFLRFCSNIGMASPWRLALGS